MRFIHRGAKNKTKHIYWFDHGSGTVKSKQLIISLSQILDSHFLQEKRRRRHRRGLKFEVILLLFFFLIKYIDTNTLFFFSNARAKAWVGNPSIIDVPRLGEKPRCCRLP